MVRMIGHGVLEAWAGAEEFLRLCVFAFAGFFRVRPRWERLLEQLFGVAVGSAPVIALSLLFLSLMLITEFSFHMKLVLRQDSLVPAFSTLLLIRELGPVVTALLLTSRVGAGIAAEIALMKATEQLDALRLLSLDPVAFLVPTRWVACVFAAVTLTLVSLGVGILGGAALSAVTLGYGVGEFFNTMFTFARIGDLWGCLAKSAVFGSLLALVAAHHGFRSRPGSRGVGDAATGAVVQASVLIILADFLLTWVFHA